MHCGDIRFWRQLATHRHELALADDSVAVSVESVELRSQRLRVHAGYNSRARVPTRIKSVHFESDTCVETNVMNQDTYSRRGPSLDTIKILQLPSFYTCKSGNINLPRVRSSLYSPLRTSLASAWNLMNSGHVICDERSPSVNMFTPC